MKKRREEWGGGEERIGELGGGVKARFKRFDSVLYFCRAAFSFLFACLFVRTE